MSFRNIDVYYVMGPNGAKLKVIGGEDLQLEDSHEIVVWRLHNFPPPVFPEIHFGSPGGSFLGPFTSLIRSRTELLGFGRAAVETLPAEYEYTLSVQQQLLGDPAVSPKLRIVDGRPTSLATTLVTVHSEPDGQGKHRLRVTPEAACTCVGAPLTWDFGPAIENMPGGPNKVYRPRVLFTSDSNRGYLGPYATLTTDGKSVTVSDRRDKRALRYFYEVELEDVSGDTVRLAADVDPILDDEGEPPASGGE